MKPFILWLTKSQIDELIGVLITNKNKSNGICNQDLFNVDELTELAEQLLEQNKQFIDILSNIKPLSKNEQLKVDVSNYKQKCEQFKNIVDEFKVHCSIYASNGNNPLNVDLDCTDCHLYEDDCCSEN